MATIRLRSPGRSPGPPRWRRRWRASRALGSVGAALLLLGVATSAAAQQAPEPHTPPRGSAERSAILDAIRSRRGTPDQVFVVQHLKVQGSWAWVAASPQSRDGRERLEPESWLLLRGERGWTVVAQPCAEVTCDPRREIARIRRRYPGAPGGIFP